MTPDDAARIGRLETAVAKLEQRVDDLRGDVKELSPLSLAVARMEGTVARAQADVAALDGRLEEFARTLRHDIEQVAKLVKQDQEEREQREQDDKTRRAEERRDARRSRVALVVGCAAAILAPVGAIVAAVIQSS